MQVVFGRFATSWFFYAVPFLFTIYGFTIYYLAKRKLYICKSYIVTTFTIH